MAQALRAGLRNGGLRRGGLRPGLGNGSLFAIAPLDLFFARNRTLDPRVTFTRASSGTYVGSDGLIKTATTNEPRFDHNPTTGESLGLLVEEQRTNSIRNNTMVGAVAGTPGTAPTNWTISNTATGLTREIVGTGTEGGVTYIDVRYSGTASASGSVQINNETTTGVAALTGQAWTTSAYVRLAGGALPGAVSWVWVERDSGGASVVSSGVGISGISSASLVTQRYSNTRTLSGGATVAFVTARIDVSVSNGATVDFTLRIGLPQLEQGAFATSVIPTSTVAVTRSADVASITGTNFSSWYNSSATTIYAHYSTVGALSGLFPSIASLSSGANSNRIQISHNGGSRRAVISSGGVAQLDTTGGDLGLVTANVAGKFALTAQNADFVAVVNGAVPVAQMSGSQPTGITQLVIGGDGASLSSSQLNGTIRRLTYWPQRLSNSTLQALTQ